MSIFCFIAFIPFSKAFISHSASRDKCYYSAAFTQVPKRFRKMLYRSFSASAERRVHGNCIVLIADMKILKHTIDKFSIFGIHLRLRSKPAARLNDSIFGGGTEETADCAVSCTRFKNFIASFYIRPLYHFIANRFGSSKVINAFCCFSFCSLFTSTIIQAFCSIIVRSRSNHISV